MSRIAELSCRQHGRTSRNIRMQGDCLMGIAAALTELLTIVDSLF